MSVTNTAAWKLGDEQRAILKSWLVEFEQSWDDDRLAARVRQLPKSGPLRFLTLVELVKIDLERNWQKGRQVRLEAYLERYPELGTPDTVAMELIQKEYEARHQAGAPAGLADFARRFPRQAEGLRRLVERAKDSYGTLEVPALSPPLTPHTAPASPPPAGVKAGSAD